MPEMPKVGDRAPDFELPDADGNTVRLADSRGKWTVVYFYPRDNTPGCTKEACDFSERLGDFQGLDAVVIGIVESVRVEDAVLSRSDGSLAN